jgi:hypothetical protein
MAKILIISFLFLSFFVSTQGIAKTNAPVKVHISDVMKTFKHNFFEFQKLTASPIKNNTLLKERINQMNDNFKVISKINKNKEMHGSIQGLKKQLNNLHVAVHQKNVANIRKYSGQIYVSCFQCHNVHRNHYGVD